MDCVFCAIVAGRLPAYLLHEEEDFLVLLDIHPLRPGHLLVISRTHAPFLHDLPVPARERLLALAERLTRALYAAGAGIEGVNLMLNDGPLANQHVPHLHLHLVPRRRGDLAALLWRALTRFLPLGRQRLHVRLVAEAELLRGVLRQEA
ncbi:MAG: HIT family protein [Pseudomonas sp.]|uniref:HIT family protein n=1 Tax=Pseudomonas sp. TaxID=306 RepID=UPI00339993CF